MKKLALTDKQILAARSTTRAGQLTDGRGLYLKLQWDGTRPAGNGHQWRFDYRRPTLAERNRSKMGEPGLQALKVAGKRNTLSFGPYPTVSLEKAREAAENARVSLRDGCDPGETKAADIDELKAAKRAVVVADERKAANLAPAGTLQGLCQDYHAKNVASGEWKPVYAQQWINMLSNHVFCHRELALTKAGDVKAAALYEAAIAPLEAAGLGVTSRCVRKFLRQAYDYANAIDLCPGNPARVAQQLAKKRIRRGHNPAATRAADLRQVLVRIADWSNPVTKAALQVQAALFQRPANTCAMRWAHVQLEVTAEQWANEYEGDEHTKPAGLWVIPAAEMKGDDERKENGADHVVPLSKQVVQVLRYMQSLNSKGCEWVFESTSVRGQPITNDTLTNALRAMGFTETPLRKDRPMQALQTSAATGLPLRQSAHGFRATARTMIEQKPMSVRGVVIEAQLAHIGGTEGAEGYIRRSVLGRAYNRATHLEERASMVQAWANYLDKLVGGNVVKLEAEPLKLAA